jgi:tetratricopeptide (TPR) repeat protein
MNARLFILIMALAFVFGCSNKHDKAESHILRGINEAKNGKLDEAEADLDKAIEIDDQNADAYFNRGILQYMKGDWNRAIDDYDQVLDLDSKYPKAYSNRGLAESSKGDLD